MRKKISFILIILLSINLAYALENSIDKSSGCSPPMSFVKEHNCTLKYTTDNVVGGFTCREWRIQGDCEGGVISSEKIFMLSPQLTIILTGVLIFVFVTLLIILMHMITKKEKEEYKLLETSYY